MVGEAATSLADHGGRYRSSTGLSVPQNLSLAYYTELTIEGDLDMSGFDIELAPFASLVVSGDIHNLGSLHTGAFSEVNVTGDVSFVGSSRKLNIGSGGVCADTYGPTGVGGGCNMSLFAASDERVEEYPSYDTYTGIMVGTVVNIGGSVSNVDLSSLATTSNEFLGLKSSYGKRLAVGGDLDVESDFHFAESTSHSLSVGGDMRFVV